MSLGFRKRSGYPSRPTVKACPCNCLPLFLIIAGSCLAAGPEPFSQTHKPVLHGRHWVAITGKPLGATAGARIFERGGNAVDAACAMLAVVCTMYDDLSWGGETQALIYDPRSRTFAEVGPMRFRRIGPVSAELPNGSVLIAAGLTVEDYGNVIAEIYVPPARNRAVRH